jgi:phosphatidate cytidylyltransferase
MFKYRLLFGLLMTAAFAGIVVLDGWIDGSVTASLADDKAVQATLTTLLVVFVMGFATLEFSSLASFKNLTVLPVASVVGVVVLSSSWYWLQFASASRQVAFALVLSGVFLAMLLEQYLRFGANGVLVNCGASCLVLIYLGIVGAFVVAVRIDFGLWELLMFVFTVKCSDIGAYMLGRLFGKHRFSPRISPGKTWEGFGGSILFAGAVSFAFASISGIMSGWSAVIFGVCLAFVGQMGDLAESMMKRDTCQKDSSSSVPGFGGILDVIDSPLVAAPFAYLLFRLMVYSR